MAQHVIYESKRRHTKRTTRGGLVVGIFFTVIGLLFFLGGNRFVGWIGLIFGGFALFVWLLGKLTMKFGME